MEEKRKGCVGGIDYETHKRTYLQNSTVRSKSVSEDTNSYMFSESLSGRVGAGDVTGAF
jgi:hypothetical protein